MVGILQLISTALDSSSGEGPVDLKIIYKGKVQHQTIYDRHN